MSQALRPNEWYQSEDWTGLTEVASFTGISFPNVARVYDALLGGKDNFESDRAVMELILKAVPDARVVARQNRAFVRRAVRFLVTEMGVRQFLDIGSGLPTAENVHEVAQALAPESRIVYVDNNPVVTSHARALLVSKPGGECGYVDSDIRDTVAIIKNAAVTLDFGEPAAVMLNAILHFIPDEDDPWEITRRLMDAVPVGSYLVLSHATGEQITGPAYREKLNEAYARTEAGGVTPRPLAGISDFFKGLELADPGIVDIAKWQPDTNGVPASRTLFYGGIGIKRQASHPLGRSSGPF